MKVTAILPDDLIEQVRLQAPAKTLTESITTALRDWVAQQRIRQSNPQRFQPPIERYSDERLAEFEQHHELALHQLPKNPNSKQALKVLRQRGAGFTPLPAESLDDYIQEARESWE